MNVGTKDCGHQIAMSTPSPGEAGTTGEWRTMRPALDRARCLTVRQDDLVCQLCWVYCPDVCIQQGVPPTVDLQYCKGCGICAEMCPVDAIRMVSEDVPSESPADGRSERATQPTQPTQPTNAVAKARLEGGEP